MSPGTPAGMAIARECSLDSRFRGNDGDEGHGSPACYFPGTDWSNLEIGPVSNRVVFEAGKQKPGSQLNLAFACLGFEPTLLWGCDLSDQSARLSTGRPFLVSMTR